MNNKETLSVKIFGFEIFTIKPKKERFLIICTDEYARIIPANGWFINEQEIRSTWKYNKEMPILYIIPYTSLI